MVLPFPKSPYFHHNTAQNDTDTLCELCDPKWTYSCSILFFDPHTQIFSYTYISGSQPEGRYPLEGLSTPPRGMQDALKLF